MTSRYSSDRQPRRSPIRLVCTVPEHLGRPAGARQAWGHPFDDPSEPYMNWADCRWTCERPIRAARFRNLRDPRRFAVLHPSTKPKGLGVARQWGSDRFAVEPDIRIESSDGWQISFFDGREAVSDEWGSSADDALLRAFGKGDTRSAWAAYDAREWKLEAVVDEAGRTYGAEP